MLVPALPGCVTWGKALKRARKVAAVAIGGYIASLVKQGESIPVDDETLSTTVEVDVPAEVSRG